MAVDPIRNESGAPEHSTTSIPPEPVFDDHSVDELLAGFPPPDRTLPQPYNPRLNRTAETIGSALGSTVGRMRNGLSLVKGGRSDSGPGLTDQISQKASDLKDTVRSQAQDLTSTVREQAGQFGDMVQDKTQQLMETSQKGWQDFRVSSRQRLIQARHRAAVLRQDHPLELIGGFAATAFAIGVALRVWRSTND
jgi:ElaB/YqjD/DUF883 family membrane-anchored ribosome-binding protein